MKYPFTYTVQAYDYDNEYFYLQNGIGICGSYKDAADILEQHYGDDLVAVKHLELYEEDKVITLPQGAFEVVIDCLNSSDYFETKCNAKGEVIL